MELIGRSPAVAALRQRIDMLARADSPVVIFGESGAGKELVARLVHERSARRARPFVAVNCSGFPATLIEAELFGHERGAFTGAVQRRVGRFRAADGGILLLDEVAELPAAAQAKLLRVLQESAVEPLGSDRPVPIDVRVMSATHRDLRALCAARTFREDLYYRLKVLDVAVPPLRDRRDDVPLLVAHFLARLAPGRAPRLSDRAMAALARHPFPGNVRELAHAVEHAFVLARGDEIDLAHLPPEIAATDGVPAIARLDEAVAAFEREHLAEALRLAGGRKQVAADLLGISRKSLWHKLRRHKLR